MKINFNERIWTKNIFSVKIYEDRLKRIINIEVKIHRMNIEVVQYKNVKKVYFFHVEV